MNIKIKMFFIKIQKVFLFLFIIQEYNFCMSEDTQEDSDKIEKINAWVRKFSEQEASEYCTWPSIEEETRASLVFFELVNKSSQNIWISILNGTKFFLPKELKGAFTNLNYASATAILPDKSSPLFIYIWLAEPTTPLIKNQVNASDIIYKILLIGKQTIFLKWSKNIEPQNDGGFFGVNYLIKPAKNFMGYNIEKRSYALRKIFDENTNVKLEDIETLMDKRKNDF